MDESTLDKTMEYVRENFRDPQLTEEMGRLARYCPDVLVGYVTIRQGAFKERPEGALSVKDKHLLCLAAELVAKKTNPVPIAHALRAIDHGATLQEIAEVAGIAIQLGGMMTYRESGRFVLKAAEEYAKERAAKQG